MSTKRSVVGSMQPRQKPATSSSTASPSTRSPSKDGTSSTPTRSTRSTGKPTHYQELQGAPKPSTGRRTSQTGWKRKREEEEAEDDDSESDDELMLKPIIVTPKKPSKPAKKASYLPSPARSTSSTSSPSRNTVDTDSSSDDDQVEKMLTDSPKRKRAAAVGEQLLTPRTTPSKKRPASVSLPKTSSPLKQSTTPSKRRATAVLSDSEEEEEVEEPKRSTPRKTPTKRKTPSASLTPTKATPTAVRTIPRSGSASSTPTRSSLRKQRLPPNVEELKNAPAELRSRLVGFHMEDEGYGITPEVAKDEEDREEEDEEEEEEEEEAIREERRRAKGKGRALEPEPEQDEEVAMHLEDEADPFSAPVQETLSTEDYALPIPPPVTISSNSSAAVTPSLTTSEYPSSFLHKHIHRQLSVLTGTTLPESRLPSEATTPSFPRSQGVMGYPFLEGGYSEWEKPLRGCLNEVVTRGMGNAVVLLGPRGVGKTMLIERTLRIMSYVHGDQHEFVTVKLSGLVHTTDRLALRSIAMQMREQGFKSVGGIDQELDEGDYSSNSATMSTLLRLLEPSSSTTGTHSNESSKPIILLVDEFDLFALHPRQSFLYCLLDIVQGNRRRGGVGVVGVSSRVDCLSLLEKRVRSRCQSHVLQMMLPSSLSDFTALATRLVSTDQTLWQLVKGREAGEWAQEWNREVERFMGEKKVKEYFEGVWRVTGNVPTELRSILTHFLSRLDYKLARGQTRIGLNGVLRLEVSDLKPRETHLTRDSTLKHLSTIELAVLIACKHLSASTIDFQTGFNLEMAYDQYLQWAKSLEARGKRIGKTSISREAFCSGFDTLRRNELILPLSTTSTVAIPSAAYLAPSRSIPFKMHRLVPREAEIKFEVSQRNDLDGELKKWGGA